MPSGPSLAYRLRALPCRWKNRLGPEITDHSLLGSLAIVRAVSRVGQLTILAPTTGNSIVVSSILV